MYGRHLLLKGIYNSGTLIVFVMNDWMFVWAAESSQGAVSVSVCDTVMPFHLFGKKQKNIHTIAVAVARMRRNSRWPNADWNTF